MTTPDEEPPRRRVRLTIEADSNIEIDEQKFQQLLDGYPSASSIKKQQELIEKMMNGQEDYLSRDDIANLIVKEGGYEKHADTLITAVIQVHCAKHDYWTDLDNTKVGGECIFCYQDRKDAEAERKEARERSRSV